MATRGANKGVHLFLLFAERCGAEGDTSKERECKDPEDEISMSTG